MQDVTGQMEYGEKALCDRQASGCSLCVYSSSNWGHCD